MPTGLHMAPDYWGEAAKTHLQKNSRVSLYF